VTNLHQLTSQSMTSCPTGYNVEIVSWL